MPRQATIFSGGCGTAPSKKAGGSKFRKINPGEARPRNFPPSAGQEEFACPPHARASTLSGFDPRQCIEPDLSQGGSTPEHSGGPSDHQLASAAPPEVSTPGTTGAALRPGYPCVRSSSGSELARGRSEAQRVPDKMRARSCRFFWYASASLSANAAGAALCG